MPHLTVESIAPNTRCSHLFPASGRQCRLLASDPHSGLCAHHLTKKRALEKDADFFVPLMKRANCFQTAQEINHSLNHLYDLLARDRISARRAATLAYISSLLLRTLPAIDNDVARGIHAADHSSQSAHTPANSEPRNTSPEPDSTNKPS